MDDRWVAPAIAAVVALAAGFGIGALVYADDADTTEGAQVAPAPTVTVTPAVDQETCLAALEAVEQDVQAEERLSTLLDEYEDVIGRSASALSDFDTRELERLLSEVEDLNVRSEELIADSRDTDLQAAIDTCREVLGEPAA